MHRTALILCSLLLLSCSQFGIAVERVEYGNLVLEGIPPIPQTISERLAQYQSTRSATVADWSPDGKSLLIHTRFSDTNQLHLVHQPLGARQQITFYKEPVRGGSFSTDPDRNGLLFYKDIGGNEYHQIYYFDLNTNQHRVLTDGKSKHGPGLWSNRGDRFAFYSTKRDGKNRDIYVARPDESGSARMVLQVNGAWFPVDWSPDDTQLLVNHYISATEDELYVVDVTSGKKTQIKTSSEKVAYDTALFSKDGKGIYFSSDDGTEFRHLRYIDIKSGQSHIISADIPWDIPSLALSKDGRYMAFIANQDGIARLYLKNLDTNRAMDVPALPAGRISGLVFSPDGRKLAMTISTANSPSDAYVYGLDTKKLVRWTQSEVGGLNTDRFPKPTLLRYPSFDKVDGKPRQIPAFIYKPTAKGPHPVVIHIHGGPEGQYRPYFSALTQYLVNEQGVAVIAPNVRGSRGYGKSYMKLDNDYRREDSVKDIGALLDWITTQQDLDADKVIVFGGSYGGYMVLASMTHYSKRLLGGIDVVGISNFVTFLKNTKSYRRDLRRVEYGDERDPEMFEFLQRISPNNNAKKITRPLLVVQGLNDPRVPASESEQMVQTIRANGGQVWYLLARDEGHGFRKKKNRDFYYATVATFVSSLLE